MSMTNPIFKHSWKDSYLILYTIFLGALPFFFMWLDVSFWILAVIFPVHAWLITNLQNGPLHHHTHWSTFKTKKLNNLYEIVLSAVGGIPNQIWKYAHLKHHIYVNDIPVNGTTKDPVSVFLHGKDGKVENFWSYCVRGIYNDFKKAFFPIKFPNIVNKQRCFLEQMSFNLYVLSIIVLDFHYGIYMLLVYALAYFLNKATSYGEHWGVLDRRGDTTQDSIGIYSRWYNIIGFGAGYHQEHHNKPNMHWTQLHTITPRMHPDRVIKGGMHITNNPYWSHFKLLFKK
jgi:fatty acid desaturase